MEVFCKVSLSNRENSARNLQKVYTSSGLVLYKLGCLWQNPCFATKKMSFLCSEISKMLACFLAYYTCMHGCQHREAIIPQHFLDISYMYVRQSVTPAHQYRGWLVLHQARYLLNPASNFFYNFGVKSTIYIHNFQHQY